MFYVKTSSDFINYNSSLVDVFSFTDADDLNDFILDFVGNHDIVVTQSVKKDFLEDCGSYFEEPEYGEDIVWGSIVENLSKCTIQPGDFLLERQSDGSWCLIVYGK